MCSQSSIVSYKYLNDKSSLLIYHCPIKSTMEFSYQYQTLVYKQIANLVPGTYTIFTCYIIDKEYTHIRFPYRFHNSLSLSLSRRGSIIASPAYGVYVSQLIRYYRAYVKQSDFLDRAQMLTLKMNKQGQVEVIATNILRSSSQSG